MSDIETQPHHPDCEYEPNERKRKSTARTGDDGCHDFVPPRLAKRIFLSFTKPSYVLGLGSKSVRTESRVRLTHLLRRLVLQHNWTEASGVMSMLLKGTCKDRSPVKNRFKYSVLMELLDRLGEGYFRESRIKNMYDIWARKNGRMNHRPAEERFTVDVEFILFSLSQGDVEEAHEVALSLIEKKDFERDAMSNMIVGLTYRQKWYSTLPEKMVLMGSDQFCTSKQSKELLAYSLEHHAVNSHEVGTAFSCDSGASVRKNDILSYNTDSVGHSRPSFGIDNMQIENLPQNPQPVDFYADSVESAGNEAPLFNYGDQMQYAAVFSALEGLDSFLLPLRLPHGVENCEDLLDLHREILNENYKSSLKYLHQALYTEPPLLVALLPFIQLLVIGGQVDGAFHELERFCFDSETALPFRLKARLLEHFDCNNRATLSACFEDALKKDPTCYHSLSKLIKLHQTGNYGLESLLEMIALHLDATAAEYSVWREFALCFLKLSESEEDRMSVCLDGKEGGPKKQYSVRFNNIPKIFTEGSAGRSWRLRSRWWLTRYFSHDMLASDIAAGNLQLLSYKAACASHMYGKQFYYVVDACTCLEKENERDLLLFLQRNMEYSLHLSSTTKMNTKMK